MTDPEQTPPRRRRRAVGPVGAPQPGSDRYDELVEPAPRDEPAPADDDERLRRDVPPHHGG